MADLAIDAPTIRVRSTASRCRFSTIFSVSSVKSSALYIFSSCRNSSFSYSKHQPERISAAISDDFRLQRTADLQIILVIFLGDPLCPLAGFEVHRRRFFR